MRGRFGIYVARLVPSPGTTWLAALLASVFLSAPPSADARSADGGAPALVIPLLTPADDVRQGFARIINHSARAGTVRIYGTDDGGRVHGPVTLFVNAGAAREFSSRDLEAGSASKGLSGHLGNGEGSWRLRLESDLDIEAGAYLRTPDGFVASVHDVVRTAVVGGETVHRVPIFNPGSNRDQVSWLRLVNLTDAMVDVTIEGRDDEGESALGGEVRLTLPAGSARYLSAQQLESVGAGLGGRLGDGRWQLFVTAGGPIEVASLMQTPAGHLTNLSRSGLRGTGLSGTESVHPVGSTFRGCAACPEMVAVPAGSYLMGSPEDETDRGADEGPVHRVTIAEPFAVGRYEVTFAQWDACHRAGGCSHNPDDQGWGRGNRPVVDVSWNDAQEYVRWLSAWSGQDYRLLSESEWEYVARAGTTTRYWWGDEIGRNRANCDGCGSPWDTRQTAPVGSFSANAFGLHDVHGNVREWVQDCRNDSYAGAPADGSAWESGNCTWHGVRGGSWQTGHRPRSARAANRGYTWPPTNRRFDGTASIGFRVARALIPRNVHTLPLFRPAGQPPQGVARIINRSDRAGTVRIVGTDDAGRVRGPVILDLDPGATRNFDSDDLEEGNAFKGLFGSLGDGTGDWRLELTTSLDIEPSAYVRTPDGLLAPMHAVARTVEVGGATVHQVPIFNSGSNRHETSWLRVANLTDDDVLVTIRGRDDSGEEREDAAQPTEVDEVRLTLPAGEARRLSAQQLESGDHPDLSGRLGEGTGKWRLFVTPEGEVTAGGAIEVISLVQSPTGHLSNLSTTVRTGFEVVAGGSATVRPLEAIHLAVPDGLGDSDYTVLMDLSGTGEFPEDDTIEIEGLTTDDDRILTASPLTQFLPDANTSHRLAVRVRREVDRQLSNVLGFSIEDITIPAHLSGYSTTALEVVLKSLYLAADDPLLKLGAPSIQPGLSVQSARRLNLDTTLSDVQAEAILQSLFGVSLADWAAENPSRPAGGLSATPHTLSAPAHALITPHLTPGASRECGGIFEPVCAPFRAMLGCIGDEIARFTSKSSRLDVSDCSEVKFRQRLVEGFQEYTEELVATISIGRWGVGRLLRKNIHRLPVEQRLITSNAMIKPIVEIGKVMQAVKDPSSGSEESKRHLLRNKSGGLSLTKLGRKSHFESQRAIGGDVRQHYPKLIGETETHFGSRNLDDEERESVAATVGEGDRQLREAKRIERLEGVYLGEEKLREAIGNDSDSGLAVAANCKRGYREFPIDDETSTCVFESLVEENCYKGSRQPSDVNLGESGACLYYSLDYIQPNEKCRDNYEKVHFQGRLTCRWADLGPEQAHSYTLHKALDDEPTTDDEQPEEPEQVEQPGTGNNLNLCTPQFSNAVIEGSGYPNAVVPTLEDVKDLCRSIYCSLSHTDFWGCDCCDTIGSAPPSRRVSIDTFQFIEPAGCKVTGYGIRNTLASNVIEVSDFEIPRDAEACTLAVKSARLTCEQAIFHPAGESINQACPATAAVQQERQRCWNHFTAELAKCGPASD